MHRREKIRLPGNTNNGLRLKKNVSATFGRHGALLLDDLKRMAVRSVTAYLLILSSSSPALRLSTCAIRDRFFSFGVLEDNNMPNAARIPKP